jgi:hypothetical protein
MAVLPRPSGRVETILERVVPAIFASIATLSLITDEPGLVEGPILLAAAGACWRAAPLVRPVPGWPAWPATSSASCALAGEVSPARCRP